MSNKKGSAKIILLCVIIVLLVAAYLLDVSQYLSIDFFKQQRTAIDELYQRRPGIVLLSYFLVYVLVASLSIPGAVVLTLAGGAVFGFLTGLIVVSFASTVGATVAFLLTRYLLRDWVQARFGDRLHIINQGIQQDGAFYVFGLRLVPVFPFFMVNIVLALTPLKVWTFYWVSQLGMLAGTMVYVNAGTQLAQLQELSDIANPFLLISFSLLGVFPIIARRALAIAKTQRKQEG